jgi:polo-like kinase 4
MLIRLQVPLLTPSGSGAPSAQLLASTELHQVLHHPTIVSLLSTFSTRTAHYRVVELCSRGTLSGFLGERRPAVLSESELRSLLKSVVDALIYLSKERIVHNGIAATNILLADDYRIVRRLELGGI